MNKFILKFCAITAVVNFFNLAHASEKRVYICVDKNSENAFRLETHSANNNEDSLMVMGPSYFFVTRAGDRLNIVNGRETDDILLVQALSSGLSNAVFVQMKLKRSVKDGDSFNADLFVSRDVPVYRHSMTCQVLIEDEQDQ